MRGSRASDARTLLGMDIVMDQPATAALPEGYTWPLQGHVPQTGQVVVVSPDLSVRIASVRYEGTTAHLEVEQV